MFCLPIESVKKLKEAIKSGEFNPEKLNSISDSKVRREFLAKIVGDSYAEEVNLLFEKKLLLKNQEKAMYDFGREIIGLSKEAREATLAKIKATFAEKNRALYDPAENEKFLNEITSDIYSKKYKTEVSLDEAQTITELSSDVKKYRSKMNTDFSWPTKDDGLKFGASKVALENYVGSLKLQANTRSLVNIFKEKRFRDKLGGVVENAKISVNFIAENSKSIVASLDNSLWFRQGLKALLNPRYTKIWAKNFATSWIDIGKTIKNGTNAGDAILDGVRAEIYSRKNYLNGRYDMGKKLDIGSGEEAFPTSLPARLGEIPTIRKIPILKNVFDLGARLFKASEVAYEAGAMRLRVDIADKIYNMAEKVEVDLTDKFETGSINEIVNSMTGRGRIPTGESFQKNINKAFFSIKFFKSNLDTLTAHSFSNISSFARKEAAINLLSIASVLGVIFTLAKTLDPKHNKDIFDSRSSNFGKLRIGRYMSMDMTGGMGGIVVLITKILSQSSKSSTTGVVSKLGEGYGSQTGMDVLWSFTENKFSPMFGVLRDFIKQKDFKGNKPTIMSETQNLTTPIIIGNLKDFRNEDPIIQIIGLIADGIGLNTGVYEPTADWGQSTTKELEQFKNKVGETKFKKANDKYNQLYNDWFVSVVDNKKYEALSDEERQKVITNKKAEIKDKVFAQYGFKYKATPTKKLPKF